MSIYIAVVLVLAGIAGLAFAFWPRSQPAAAVDLLQSLAPVEETPGDWLPVLDTKPLLERVEAVNLAQLIQRDSLAEPKNYDMYYRPVVEQFIEFAQLLPASESHHHAQPGGMILHTLEAVSFAIKKRQGMMLPRGARPEEQARLKHRWTYAVLVAGLLHDIGKPMRDLKVTFFKHARDPGTVWNPLAGSLKEVGAKYYHVAFSDPDSRDYSAHTKLPVALLQRCVPQPAVQWLSEDQAVMKELTDYLSGEKTDGVLAQLITEADGESVRRNLLSGPRTRFATARVVPLIERLMEAMRRMLAEGGTLPLNRNGAAGWVHQGEIWFVAKRLADEVRTYLRRNESASGLPGDDKNDRLFDTWQEHGALIPNTATNQAVWRVRIEGFDGGGYKHEFAVLRFPLSLLYAHPDQYPKSFVGEIHHIGPVTPGGGAGADTPADSPAASTGTVAAAQPGTAAEAAVETPPQPVSPALATPDANPAPAPKPIAVPAMRINEAAPQLKTIAMPPADEDDDKVVEPQGGDFLDEGETAAAVAKPEKPAPTVSTPAAGSKAKPSATVSGKDLAAKAQETASIQEKVEPAGPTLPALDTQRPQTEVAEEAAGFLAWLKTGLRDARLTYNCPNARVHFLEEGLLVVSPVTFREYATGALAEAGQSTNETAVRELESKVQKAVVKAGWTLKGPKRVNIIKYRVVKTGGAGKGSGPILNGMVFARPFIEQHVTFPAINLFLERFQPEIEAQTSKA